MTIIKKFIFAVAMLSTVAAAEIYRRIDPATGAVEYTTHLGVPPVGAIRLDGSVVTQADVDKNRSKLVADEAKLKKAAAAERLVLEDAANARKKKAQESMVALAQQFPASCRKIYAKTECEPAPGMPLSLAVYAFGFRQAGFTHNASGRVDRYLTNGCTVYASAYKITSVSC